MSRKIVVGSRESRLAIIQTEKVMEHIRRSHPEIELEMMTMETTGDKRLDVTLDQIGGKGLFVKELDKALLDGRIDLAVHSLKAVSYTHLDVYKRQVVIIGDFHNTSVMHI